MIRLLMMLSVVVVVFFSIFDDVYLRHHANKKEVHALRVDNARWEGLVIDNQEVIHDSVIEGLSEDAIVTIFNYHPGRAREHIAMQEIRDLFVTDAHYEKFRSQFLVWSDHEFRVNNISIKETVSPRGQLYRIGVEGGSGVQFWKYTASIPMLDRGVGATNIAMMRIEIHLVYMGPKGGMGIYAIKLTR